MSGRYFRHPFWLALILGGCAAHLPVPKEVKVPIPVPCIEAKDVPQAPPIVTNPELLKLDEYSFVLTIYTERQDLRRYSAEQAALIEACIK